MKTTRRAMKTALAALTLALVALLTAQPATAQVSIDARGGVAIPAGDLADITETGGLVGLGVGLPLNERVTLRLDGDVDILTGQRDGGADMPDTRLWHYHVGLQFDLVDPASDFFLQPRIGLGGTTFETDDKAALQLPNDPAQDLTFNQSYFSVDGGVELGWEMNDRFSLGLGTKVFAAFTDEDETRRLTALVPDADPAGFSTATSIPLYIFLRFEPRGR